MRRLSILLALVLVVGVMLDGRRAGCACPPSCADEQQEDSSAAGDDCLKACCASPRYSLPLTAIDSLALAPIATVLPIATVAPLAPATDEIPHVPKLTA